MAIVYNNYNIKQVTNYDVDENNTIYYEVQIPKVIRDSNNKPIISSEVKTVPYTEILTNTQILKFGYCCEPKGVIFPIYIKTDGDYKRYEIGKDGMYEMQIEQWTDDEVNEERSTNITVTGIRVPKNIKFTLDYVLSIT